MFPRHEDAPRQLLPREAYVTESCLERERSELFDRTWTLAGVLGDFERPGDYRTVRAGNHPLFVLRDHDGELKAHHNLCRHRGTELLEGRGNAGNTITCPYHHWNYGLDGALRGVPRQNVCFPDLDKRAIRLKTASLGIFRELVFVHPSPTPEESFEDWLAGLPDVAWPHDIAAAGLASAWRELVYEMKCNWKVFYENAVDGYHLAYLHKDTLGGPLPEGNVWEATGRHLVWYSTEREGRRNRLPALVEDHLERHGTKKIEGAEQTGYGGIYMLFPSTIVLPSPYSLSISTLEPVDAHTTLLKIRSWLPRDAAPFPDDPTSVPGYDEVSGRIKSSHWKQHPLETGDFQTEDVWVCEKMQRSLQSPSYEVGPLAHGSGAESPLAFFQERVLEFLE